MLAVPAPVTLPASGVQIALRDPGGADELLLHESHSQPIETALALLARLGGDQADWPGLVITDFEHLLLSLRAARFGPRMALGFVCPQCQARAEVNFRVADLQDSVSPRCPASVTADADRPGWYQTGEAAFRLPTAADLAAAAAASDPAAVLAGRCLGASARARSQRARVERLMASMAPELSRQIAAACPECAAAVAVMLSVPRVVIAELKREAAQLYEEIDLIAGTYHWPEAEILALPQPRRRAYADRIRRAQAKAA
jgi:hypothetical protein